MIFSFDGFELLALAARPCLQLKAHGSQLFFRGAKIKVKTILTIRVYQTQ